MEQLEAHRISGSVIHPQAFPHRPAACLEFDYLYSLSYVKIV